MEIKVKTVEVGENQPIDIFFLGDIHEGSASLDYDALREAVDIIVQNAEKNENTYVCLMGDLIDAIIPGDPRFDPSEVSPNYSLRDLKDLPRKQARNLYDGYLKPIAENVISINVGNHEEQYIKRHSNDIYNSVYGPLFPNAGMLGYFGLLRLKINVNGHLRKNLDIALNHGAGGAGFREGWPINKVFDVFRWVNADFRVMGHIHRLAAKPAQFLSLSPVTNRVHVDISQFGVSGCFMLKHKEGTRNYFEGKAGELAGIGILKGRCRIIRKQIDNERKFICKTSLQEIWLH